MHHVQNLLPQLMKKKNTQVFCLSTAKNKNIPTAKTIYSSGMKLISILSITLKFDKLVYVLADCV